MTLPAPGSTARTTIKRIPDRAVTDRDAGYRIIDAALMAHVAVVIDEQPYVMPVACARDGDSLVFHGSSASRLFKALGSGTPCCATITMLDGLVVARSAFESSMNYRSVMVLGRAELLEGSEKAHALDVITEHLMPGRLADVRPTTPQELKATAVARLALDEFSVKVRVGGPDEPSEDRALPIWAGVIPLMSSYGPAITEANVPDQVPVPEYLKNWRP